jgi:rRNA maturation endonuclease Nob1
MSRQTRFLVLDASVWIQCPETWLQSATLASKLQLHTVPEVVREVRDEAARGRLQRLLDSSAERTGQAATLQITAPSNTSIERVESIARYTGDYGYISSTDVKVLALALDLANNSPEHDARTERDPCTAMTTAKFVGEALTEPREPQKQEEQGIRPITAWRYHTLRQEGVFDPSQYRFGEGLAKFRRSISGFQASACVDASTALGSLSLDRESTLSDIVDRCAAAGSATPATAAGAASAAPVLCLNRDLDGDAVLQSAGRRDATPQRDAGGASRTVTEAHRGRHRSPLTLTSVDALRPGQVAVATADFSLQNVMLYLGIPLMRIASQPSIQHQRRFIRLCTACNRCIEAHELDEQTIRFCPQCGNYGTLVRCLKETTAGINAASGAVSEPRERILLPRHMRTVDGAPRLSTRGSMFSIPKPVGGREGFYKDLILRPDEYADKLHRHQRLSRRVAAAASKSSATSMQPMQPGDELFGPRLLRNIPDLPVVAPTLGNAHHMGPKARHPGRRR